MKLTIHTVAPDVKLGEIVISRDRRSNGKNIVPEDQRIRRVILPAGFWQEFHAVIGNERNQGMTDILRGALRSIGDDRLKDALEENPLLREVDSDDYTIAALLAWSADTASSRGSIPFTRDQVVEWFKNSATRNAAIARYTAAGDDAKRQETKLAFMEKRFATLAAKNHGLKDAADAEKLLALVAPEDAETGTGMDVVGRISHIIKALTSRQDEAAISMDEL